MAKWEISKEFEFDYSHRVWTQTLDPDLSLTTCTKCRWPHGHRGKIIVHLSSDSLINGMVMDFVELNWFKKFIDDVLDHKCIIDVNDPTLIDFWPVLKSLSPSSGLSLDTHLIWFRNEGFWKIQKILYADLESHHVEMYDGLVIVPFIPTSENLSSWLWSIVQNKLVGISTVSKVEFYETPKSKSVYYG